MAELPAPPEEMMFLATAGKDARVFLATGLADRDHIISMLAKAGLDVLMRQSRILDWGCGCGRIARHWVPFTSTVELHGCDVAVGPVQWCKENLRFGEFTESHHNPPLPYPAGYFDAIYATSVLTHLTFDAQYLWMQEIWRLLKPDGLAVLTAHGPTLIPTMLPAISGAATQNVSVVLLDEELFLCVQHGQGSNQTGNVETNGALRTIFAPFEIVNYRPRSGLMGIQDIYVFKKKGRKSSVFYCDHVYESDMTGLSHNFEIDLDLRDAQGLCVLATVRDLLYPATIEIALRRSSESETLLTSGPVELPQMVQWTGLTDAFSSVTMGHIQQESATLMVSGHVVSSANLDGRKLQLRKAVVY